MKPNDSMFSAPEHKVEPAPQKWEDVDKWMEGFPEGIIAFEGGEQGLRNYRLGNAHPVADEYGRRRYKTLRVSVEVYPFKGEELAPPGEDRTRDLCENPKEFARFGPINPHAYYCENSKFVHIDSMVQK